MNTIVEIFHNYNRNLKIVDFNSNKAIYARITKQLNVYDYCYSLNIL